MKHNCKSWYQLFVWYNLLLLLHTIHVYDINSHPFNKVLNSTYFSIILLICGSKPMSSILSASSRHKNRQSSRLIFPRSRMSTSLPGVATRR